MPPSTSTCTKKLYREGRWVRDKIKGMDFRKNKYTVSKLQRIIDPNRYYSAMEFRFVADIDKKYRIRHDSVHGNIIIPKPPEILEFEKRVIKKRRNNIFGDCLSED